LHACCSLLNESCDGQAKKPDPQKQDLSLCVQSPYYIVTTTAAPIAIAAALKTMNTILPFLLFILLASGMICTQFYVHPGFLSSADRMVLTCPFGQARMLHIGVEIENELGKNIPVHLDKRN
jgi:hypothetical protein